MKVYSTVSIALVC